MRVSWGRLCKVGKIAAGLDARSTLDATSVSLIVSALILMIPIAFAAASQDPDMPAPLPPDASSPSNRPETSSPEASAPSNRPESSSPEASAPKSAPDDSKARGGDDRQAESKRGRGEAESGGNKKGEPAGVAPLPDERLGIRTAPLLLLSRPDVRGELAMTPAQTEAAEHAITDLYVQASRLAGKPNEEVLALRKALITAQVRWIEANLTDEQKTRLVQIDLQWEGPSSLVSRPLVADTLKLTAEQRERIAKAVLEREKARKEHGPRLEDERRLAVVALETLAPDQREHWRALLGKEFVPRLASKPVKEEKK